MKRELFFSCLRNWFDRACSILKPGNLGLIKDIYRWYKNSWNETSHYVYGRVSVSVLEILSLLCFLWTRNSLWEFNLISVSVDGSWVRLCKLIWEIVNVQTVNIIIISLQLKHNERCCSTSGWQTKFCFCGKREGVSDSSCCFPLSAGFSLL